MAIAEQTETPEQAKAARGSKATVDRAIVRVVTAGTLTEDSLLDPARGQLVGGRTGGSVGCESRVTLLAMSFPVGAF